MPKEYEALHELVIDCLGSKAFVGAKVLDVGSFKFKDALAMQEAGAAVTGIDHCLHADAPAGIDFSHTDFLNWEPEPSRRVDVAYLSRVAMFMPNAKVMEKIASLDPRVIAVRTMSAHPEPNWPKERLRPLYFTMPEDWKLFFEQRGYETVHAEAYDHHHPDLSGVPRLFHMVDFIARKR